MNNPAINAEKGIKGFVYVAISVLIRELVIRYLSMDEVSADGIAAAMVGVIIAVQNKVKHSK